jgi:hypothetical protein
MTMTSVYAVGYCAHYSRQGEWAFDLALDLARRRRLPLKIFHFLADPYDPGDHVAESLDRQQRERLAIERERELRLYYDDKLGDFLEAGFRVCEDPAWGELHRCLCKREFQVLVLGYPCDGATFGGRPLEKFVNEFACPTVLVGPGSPTEYRLNSPAELIADRIGLARPDYRLVRAAISA